MIKVKIDPSLCRGHQMCLLGAPDVFVVGDNDEGQAVVSVEDQPDARMEELLNAAASCPQQAIRVQR